MKKFTFFPIIIICLTSCNLVTITGKWTNFKVPPGTPAFQQGFKDGCSSGYYSRGNVFYRTRYDYRYDPKMIGNAEYRFGHSRGYSWCFTQMTQGQSTASRSFDRYLMPNGPAATYDMAPATVDSAWGGFFSTGLQAPLNSTSTPGGLDGSFSILQNGIAGGNAGAGQSAFGNPFWSGETSARFMGIW